MKKVDLSRYERGQLESMLYSYRTLAREHLEAGHWALAKWATRMVTHIVIRLGEMDQEEQRALDAQLRLEGAEY